jgi:hypothetical protein
VLHGGDVGGCTLVEEDAAYTYVLRSHPYTNCHALVEASVNLTRLEALGGARIALRSIYAAKPVGMASGEYLQRKLFFYRRVRLPDSLVAPARDWAVEARRRAGAGRVVGVHVRYTDNLHDRSGPHHAARLAFGPAAGWAKGLGMDSDRVCRCDQQYASRGGTQCCWDMGVGRVAGSGEGAVWGGLLRRQPFS